MIRSMIDIEAFGPVPSGAVASVGVAWFDEERVTSTQYITLPLNVQIEVYERTLDLDTVWFWMRQPREAFADFRREGDTFDLEVAVDNVRTALMQPVDAMWALPPSYDFIMLRDLLRAVPVALGDWHPPSFRLERDARTVREACPAAFHEQHRKGRRHHALDDAIFQAESIIRAEQMLGVQFK